MNKISEIPGFTGFRYVKTRLMGLTTTVIYFKDQLHEIRKEYVCMKCLRPVKLIYKPNMSKEQGKFLESLQENCVCKDCHKQPELLLN